LSWPATGPAEGRPDGKLRRAIQYTPVGLLATGSPAGAGEDDLV